MRDLAAAVGRAAALLGPLATRDAPLGSLTTYRVGGRAALLVVPASEDELVSVGRAVRDSGVAVLVVGRGSNLLVADAGFAGLAVVLAEPFDAVTIDGTRVVAGGAASLPVVARRSAAAGLTGLEWAVGIPGSVGGGVRMNAGGHGSDLAAVLVRARVVGLASGEVGWQAAPGLDLGYRHSNLGAADVVVAAELRAGPGDRATSEALIDEIVRWRRTNPPGDAAGRLIDAAGLKGFRIGTAAVSDKHANFVVADEGGSADDVLAVLTAVREQVRRRTGVELRTEIRLIGFADTYPHVVDGGPHVVDGGGGRA